MFHRELCNAMQSKHTAHVRLQIALTLNYESRVFGAKQLLCGELAIRAFSSELFP
jgi:hypothetical protein